MGVSEITRKAVFLDRDGVVNEVILRDGRPYPPDDLESLRLVSGVEDCLADLKRAGFLLILVTNQPDVARGKQGREVVEAIHAFLTAHLPIDDVFVCYHDDKDECDCRKPAPGLLLQAAKRHHIDLSRSFMIGDRWRDIEAANRAGCTAVFIDYGYNERRPSGAAFEAGSLRQAADWIQGPTRRRSLATPPGGAPI